MIDPSCVERYDRLLALDPRHERRGKTMPYTSANGHMYSFVSTDADICLRLSDADRGTFRERHGGGDVVQHGRVVKEYVSVPTALLENSGELLAALNAALDYVLSLPPKTR